MKKEEDKTISIMEMFRFTERNDKVMVCIAALFSFGAGGLIPVYVYYVGKANQFLTELTDQEEV